MAGMNNGAGNITALGAQTTQQLMQQLAQMAQLSSQYTVQLGNMSMQTAMMEFKGMIAQMELNQLSTLANINSDLANLSLKTNLGLANKMTEMAVFVAQTREKMFNLFANMEEQRNTNTWTRIKSAAQNMRY